MGQTTDYGVSEIPVTKVASKLIDMTVPLKVAFQGKTDIPVVQVSLPGDSSAQTTVKLGRALASLRAKGYTIIGSGQIVHNLRDICELLAPLRARRRSL